MSTASLILGVLLILVYVVAIRVIALALDVWEQPRERPPEPDEPEVPESRPVLVLRPTRVELNFRADKQSPDEPPPVPAARLRPSAEAAARIHATEGVTRCDCYQCVVVRSVIDQLFGGEE